MRTRDRLGVLLVACFSVSTADAQQPAPSVQDAERALADALMRHDRAAFVELFTPDAECSFPVVTHGPEAIANEWVVFFVDPGTTMILTTSGVVTARAGDTGTSTGTFAIRGRTREGVQTIPVGAYSITWRLVDGRWKIAMLTASGHTTDNATRSGGVGPYRFGMTRDEVRRVADCGPYTDVGVTGGLECAHFRFDGRDMNISFLFACDRLRRIQLWVYEGESKEEAREAIGRVLAFLTRTSGGALISGFPQAMTTADAVVSLLGTTPLQGRQVAQVEILTPSCPQPEIWFSRIGRHEYGYLVLLFADARDPRQR